MRRIIKILGCLVMLGGLVSGCALFSPPTPVSTPALGFVTITPLPSDSPSPGTVAATATVTPVPTLTPTPGDDDELITPLPTTPPPSVTLPLSTPLPSDPYAVIDSPGGSLNVRSGPGLAYSVPLGTYSNGATVDILGKQSDSEGRLWWLIPFPTSPTEQGWIFADYTIAYNVDKVPWVNPTGPPPTYQPPNPPPIPHAIIDSPNGFVRVRSGPGTIYEELGTLRNGDIVDILGKQRATNGQLWWLIFFPSIPYSEGWVYANETISKYIEGVPWVAAPATPTSTPTTTLTPTPTATGEPLVEWRISGRVVDSVTAQPIGGASVRANLGSDGPSLVTVADSSGAFSLIASAPDRGDLTLIITAQGYTERILTTAPRTPRTYDFPNIELSPTQPPAITWAISGRVTEIGTDMPIANAQVEAVLGDAAVRLGTVTDANGQFSVSGEASDSGVLTLNLTAEGYQPNNIISDQTDSRIYALNDLQMVPLANSCLYESVLDLNEAAALARLQEELSFTNVTTTSFTVDETVTPVGRVLTQQPEPPPDNQTIRVGCQIPITLGIGVAGQ